MIKIGNLEDSSSKHKNDIKNAKIRVKHKRAFSPAGISKYNRCNCFIFGCINNLYLIDYNR